MEVRFTPEIEAQLNKLATRAGKDADFIVQDLTCDDGVRSSFRSALGLQPSAQSTFFGLVGPEAQSKPKWARLHPVPP
jgi:hypothetical protein